MHMRRRILSGLAIIVMTAGCTNAKIQADLMSEIQRAADELNAQRQDMAVLQEQVDSLKFAIAKQDTLVRKLANLAGIPGGY
jgi:peptidoglycan hydrolase CwlO-like protein